MWRCECEYVKMWRCEDEQMWRWADVEMRRCEDVKIRRCEEEQMWRWADVKMRRCWRWEDKKRRRCEEEQMWRRADVKTSRREDEQMWRWEGVREGVKMRRWDTDPHYWKNPALRRSREKYIEKCQSLLFANFSGGCTQNSSRVPNLAVMGNKVWNNVSECSTDLKGPRNAINEWCRERIVQPKPVEVKPCR